jgi:uncharacterized membrane protein
VQFNRIALFLFNIKIKSLRMKNRPLTVIIVSLLFILAGGLGLAYHLKELFESDNNLNETIWIFFLRILAVVCGLLLLFRINWARWLAIAWLLYHVIISTFNSTSEMIAHVVFLILVSVLLFLPVSSAYFQSKNK